MRSQHSQTLLVGMSTDVTLLEGNTTLKYQTSLNIIAFNLDTADISRILSKGNKRLGKD